MEGFIEAKQNRIDDMKLFIVGVFPNADAQMRS